MIPDSGERKNLSFPSRPKHLPSQSMKPLIFFFPVAGPLLLAAAVIHAEQTGTPRHVLGGDDSTHRLAIVAPDGSIEWEMPAGPIHDASVLANGNILMQQGWNKIVEVTPDKKTVWEYDAAKSNGNEGKRLEVHAFQRLENGLT